MGLLNIDTGRMCVESGIYRMNFASCKGCNSNNITSQNVAGDDTDDDSDDEECEVVENIKYYHQCHECGHVIATHKVRLVQHV